MGYTYLQYPFDKYPINADIRRVEEDLRDQVNRRRLSRRIATSFLPKAYSVPFIRVRTQGDERFLLGSQLELEHPKDVALTEKRERTTNDIKQMLR
ncbi:hypothetical protein RB195_014663 [Necator americanus]|uniref:Uncharacterized protein n=1 Tax=Necator americanus TaxID=51031 RepID=A0ABR1E1J9_NECAM